jgi:hypothetical protein
MRIDPEIEDQAMEAARRAGSENDLEYWKRKYLTSLEREKERKSERAMCDGNWDCGSLVREASLSLVSRPVVTPCIPGWSPKISASNLQ